MGAYVHSEVFRYRMTRTKFIRARVTAEEYAEAEKHAAKSGRKLSEYVRERCVYEPKMKRKP